MQRILVCALVASVLLVGGGAASAQTSSVPRAHSTPIAESAAIVIPEPATLGLLAVGFTAVFYRRRPRSGLA